MHTTRTPQNKQTKTTHANNKKIKGNYCKGGRLGRDSGNGRVIVSEFREGDDEGSGYDCHWEVIKEVRIPSAADFIDYSGMAFNGDKVCVVVCVCVCVCVCVWGRVRELCFGGAARAAPKTPRPHLPQPPTHQPTKTYTPNEKQYIIYLSYIGRDHLAGELGALARHL